MKDEIKMKLWIARDNIDGELCIFQTIPVKDAHKRYWRGAFIGIIRNDNFPSVTCENSPQQVELKLITKKI